jgi:GTP cyclohydrolase II
MVSQPRAPKNHLKLATPSNKIRWGDRDPLKRGAIVGTVTNLQHRNVIGTHGGAYSVYRALSVAAGQMTATHRGNFAGTEPGVTLLPNPAWFDPNRIVSLDPWGATVTSTFASWIAKGYDLRPTIAMTQAQLTIPEIHSAIATGQLVPDGRILLADGAVGVTKIAIDPVWYLPGIAQRIGTDEETLRQSIYAQTGGMYSELLTRFDVKVWLPPIGGTTVYIFGNVDDIRNLDKPLTLRIHDECNGSDVFGSDICTCRPYLTHGIVECIHTAQQGGTGLIVYLRKEGRALGEVTKFLVYNARKHWGDRAEHYFERTECVAGVADARFQDLMPDVLHWLGVQRIDRLVSMSHLKHDAIVRSGIDVMERIPIPATLVPADAQVELEAKKAAGYFSGSPDEAYQAEME